MRHPALVGVRDSGVDDEGRPFVVMDFVEGQSLAARLRDGVLSVPAAIRLGAVLADALAHVHARGIVHRDVKPGNVLLDGEGRPQLTDFGIARLVDATRVTATGLVVGTAAYMAPEQVRGEIVGPPADVYALGLVLLEAVRGRREFEGGALESAIARLHRSPVVPAEIPEPLASAIRRMTATDPAERPAASGVAAVLRARPAARRPLEGHLARRLVSAGAFVSLAASVMVGMVFLSGADTSASAPGAPPEQVAAPAPDPVGAVPLAPTTTTAPVVDVPVAAAPTSQRRSPVPVALARRDRSTTVTRTVTRVTTVPKDVDERTTKSRAPKKDKGKDDKDKKDGKDKKYDKGKPDTPKDDPKDDKGTDQGGDTTGNSGGGNSGGRNSGTGGGQGDDG
jgi:hypothetical protein